MESHSSEQETGEMEVEPIPLSIVASEEQPSTSAGVIKPYSIDENDDDDDDIDDSLGPNNLRLQVERGLEGFREILDDIEEQIEKLRHSAIKITEEKEKLATTMEMLANEEDLKKIGLEEVDCEEIEATVSRLSERINSIKVEIVTPRSQNQKESLHAVNKAIDHLILTIQTDAMEANIICSQYLSATDANPNIPSDYKFEQILLGCTADDQKNVRKRLLGLQEHIKAITSEGIKEASED